MFFVVNTWPLDLANWTLHKPMAFGPPAPGCFRGGPTGTFNLLVSILCTASFCVFGCVVNFDWLLVSHIPSKLLSFDHMIAYGRLIFVVCGIGLGVGFLVLFLQYLILVCSHLDVVDSSVQPIKMFMGLLLNVH